MRITIFNNKSKLEGLTKTIMALREHPLLAIRRKGAFFSPAFQQRRWDGFVRFISERGYFDTGKLPQLISILQEQGEEVELLDEREAIAKPTKIPKRVGYLELRDYQRDALKAVVDSKAGELEFPRGILGVATNGGKTAIAAAIYKMYDQPTAFLLNSKELLKDIMKEMPKLIGQKDFGYVASSEGVEWNRFTVIMVQTAKSRMAEVAEKLAQYPVVLVDEGDLATSNTYRDVLNHTFNSYVRIALSGSAFADKRQKEKNERLRSIFGDMIYTITNEKLIKEGHSSPIRVFIWKGSPKVENSYSKNQSWQEQYESGIIKSTRRNRVIVKRVGAHIGYGRLPMMVMVKNHKHVAILYRKIKKTYPKLVVDWVHHKRKDRDDVVDRFTKKKVDILVGTFILKRGKNFPHMKALINASAGDSISNVLQIIGRATRTSIEKKETVMDDFYDEGTYLRRHSKHRITTYKNEKLKVIEKYY